MRARSGAIDQSTENAIHTTHNTVTGNLHIHCRAMVYERTNKLGRITRSDSAVSSTTSRAANPYLC